MPGKLNVTTPTDREIILVREFDAPRPLVWDCHTKPELVRKWLLGPPGLDDACVRDRPARRRQGIATSGRKTARP